MRVFIADDSAVVRERLMALLSEVPGIEVIGEAQDAGEATECIMRLKPDAVILDIRMRGRSGIDVLRDLGRMQRPPTVMMLTNYPYPQYRKRCMDAGAKLFFDKSTEFEKAVEALRELGRNSPGVPAVP